MSLGFGIFLLVVVAILTFAVHTTVAGISLVIVGAGALVVILGIALLFRTRRSTDTTRISNDTVNGSQTTQRERRDHAQ